jgi:hypothetical protein
LQHPIVLGDDVEKCADSVRPFLAVRGMGAQGPNFHFEVFAAWATEMA